jgi:hypothetical protein
MNIVKNVITTFMDPQFVGMRHPGDRIAVKLTKVAVNAM